MKLFKCIFLLLGVLISIYGQSGSTDIKPEIDSGMEWEGLIIDDVGVINGSLGIYTQDLWGRDDSITRESFANGYAILRFSSVEYNNFSFVIEGLYNEELDNNDASYESLIYDEPVIAELYLHYHQEKFNLTAGRYRPDWIMLGDAFEGLFMSVQAIEDVRINLSWIRKMAVLDPDEVINWYDINNDEDRGLAGIELTYSTELIDFSILLYGEDDYQITGIQGIWHYQNDKIKNSLLLEIYQSHENDSDDGLLAPLSNTLEYEQWALTGGLIQADEDAGAGIISELNNPWDPFDDDAHVDLPDASSWYLQAVYQLTEQLSIAGIYGETHIDQDDSSFKETNLIVSYDINKYFRIDAAYINMNTSSNLDGDYNKVWFNLSFNF